MARIVALCCTRYQFVSCSKCGAQTVFYLRLKRGWIFENGPVCSKVLEIWGRFTSIMVVRAKIGVWKCVRGSGYWGSIASSRNLLKAKRGPAGQAATRGGPHIALQQHCDRRPGGEAPNSWFPIPKSVAQVTKAHSQVITVFTNILQVTSGHGSVFKKMTAEGTLLVALIVHSVKFSLPRYMIWWCLMIRYIYSCFANGL